MSAPNPYADLIIPLEDDPYVATPFPERFPVTGNAQITALPVTAPPVRETGNPAPRLYADVAGMLDGALPAAPEPDVLACSDGVALFYSGQVNLVFGDPESGKTWLTLAAAAEALTERRRVAVLDLDHNGAEATVARLLALGAPETGLRDIERFRYAEPEDGAELVAIVRDLASWRPAVVVLDSLGEVVPLFGGSSNSPDDFTRVHTAVIKPLAMAGAAVLAVDHLAKNAESRSMGSTGTAAKKRAIGGVSLRVTIAEQFTPGKGGGAHITIAKDRHGGLRANRPAGDREPIAGTFRLFGAAHDQRWTVAAPADHDRNPAEAADAADVEALRALDPPAQSVRDARERMGWRTVRAAAAMRELRAFPVSHNGGRETGNTTQATP